MERGLLEGDGGGIETKNHAYGITNKQPKLDLHSGLDIIIQALHVDNSV